MPTASGDAPLDTVSAEKIAILAQLYDRFAQALDPFSEERDQAERVFQQEVAALYDALNSPKPQFHIFQRGIIQRCRRHLRASDKPASI